MSLMCEWFIISLQISTDSQLIFAAVTSQHLCCEKSLWSFPTSAQARERRLVEARIKECGPLVENPGWHPATRSSTGNWQPAKTWDRAFQNLPENHPANFISSRPTPEGRSGAAVTSLTGTARWGADSDPVPNDPNFSAERNTPRSPRTPFARWRQRRPGDCEVSPRGHNSPAAAADAGAPPGSPPSWCHHLISHPCCQHLIGCSECSFHSDSLNCCLLSLSQIPAS